MSYSDKNPAWDRMHKQRNDQRIQDEARIANAIQQQEPGVSRDEALRRAAKILDQQGVNNGP